MSTGPTQDLEERLEERIHRLADGIPAPVGSEEDDLARGRRRLRHRRLSAVGGAAATLAVVGVAGALTVSLPGGGVTVQQVQPAARGSNGTPADAARRDARQAAADAARRAEQQTTPRVLRESQGRRQPQGVPGGAGAAATLDRFRLAVADVLDPQGAHLDAKVSNRQISGSANGAGYAALGTKLGWHDGDGLGEIMVNVARTADDTGGFVPVTCATGETGGHPCTPVSLPDGTTGRQQHYGDTLAVYYTRPDGQVVLVAESTLFGNNSTVPVAKLPGTAEQLLRVATDPRLTLGE